MATVQRWAYLCSQDERKDNGIVIYKIRILPFSKKHWRVTLSSCVSTVCVPEAAWLFNHCTWSNMSHASYMHLSSILYASFNTNLSVVIRMCLCLKLCSAKTMCNTTVPYVLSSVTVSRSQGTRWHLWTWPPSLGPTCCTSRRTPTRSSVSRARPALKRARPSSQSSRGWSPPARPSSWWV